MIIGNIKSHTDLAKKKSIAKDLLEIEIANEAENQKRIRNYKSTYQAKAVPPVYKTPSELRQDKDKLLRDAKEKLQSLGLDYNIIQAVVSNYLNGSVDLLIKFNALFPSIRHNFQKNINPAFASVENITDLIREVMENTRNAFGFNAPTSSSFQNLENARQSYNIKKDLVDLRGSDSMIELLQDDSLSEQAKSFVERINLLIRFLPSDSDFDTIDGLLPTDKKLFYDRLGDLFKAQELPSSVEIQNLISSNEQISDSRKVLSRLVNRFSHMNPQNFSKLVGDIKEKGKLNIQKGEEDAEEATSEAVAGHVESLGRLQELIDRPFQKRELTPDVAIEQVVRKPPYKEMYKQLTTEEKFFLLKLVEYGTVTSEIKIIGDRIIAGFEGGEKKFIVLFNDNIRPIMTASRNLLGLEANEPYTEGEDELEQVVAEAKEANKVSPLQLKELGYKPEVLAQEDKPQPKYSKSGFLALDQPEEKVGNSASDLERRLIELDKEDVALRGVDDDDFLRRIIDEARERSYVIYNDIRPKFRNLEEQVKDIKASKRDRFDKLRFYKDLQRQFAEEVKGMWKRTTGDDKYFEDDYPAKGSNESVSASYVALKIILKKFFIRVLQQETDTTFEELFDLPKIVTPSEPSQRKETEESESEEEVPIPKKKGRPKKFVTEPSAEELEEREYFREQKEQAKLALTETKARELDEKFRARGATAREGFEKFKDELISRVESDHEEGSATIRQIFQEISSSLYEYLPALTNIDDGIQAKITAIEDWANKGEDITQELFEIFITLSSYYFLIANEVDLENFANPLPKAYKRTTRDKIKGKVRKVKGAEKVPPLTHGLGLKKGRVKDSESDEEKGKRIPIKTQEFTPRRIKVGRGIDPIDEPTYKTFGKYVVHIPYLHNNTANFKYKSLGGIPAIKPMPISNEYKDFILDVLATGKMNEKDLRRLDKKEVKHFEKVVLGAGLNGHFKLNKSVDDDEVKDLARFELLRGEYLAGNNAPTLVKELRSHVLKFMDGGRIKRKDGMGLLAELSAV